jgi:hypothetical protein
MQVLAGTSGYSFKEWRGPQAGRKVFSLQRLPAWEAEETLLLREFSPHTRLAASIKLCNSAAE